MKKRTALLSAIILLFVAIFGFATLGGTSVKAKEKTRLLYVESGPYFGYGGTLYAFFEALKEKGLLVLDAPIPYQWGDIDTRAMWEFVAKHGTSDTLDIRPEDFYSLKGNPGLDQELLERLKDPKRGPEIHMILTMGTVAGRTLVEGGATTPMMVFSTSNAVVSGIVKSAETSGVNHVWAHMDVNRYKKQVEIFHDLFGFKKLGMVYEDSDNAKTFAAVADVEAVSKLRGFEIVAYHVKAPVDASDQDRYFQDLLKVHTKLAGEVDAYYYTIAPLPGLANKDLPEAMAPFIEGKIPVFSQFGQEDVARGVLMSLARKDFKEVGQFGVATLMAYMEGKGLDTLPQIFSETPILAINVGVADKMGYIIPFRILMVTDMIYQTTLDEE